MQVEGVVSTTGRSGPDHAAKSLGLTKDKKTQETLLGQGHIRLVLFINGLFAVCVTVDLFFSPGCWLGEGTRDSVRRAGG